MLNLTNILKDRLHTDLLLSCYVIFCPHLPTKYRNSTNTPFIFVPDEMCFFIWKWNNSIQCKYLVFIVYACHLRARELNTKQINHAATSTPSFSIDNTPSFCGSNTFYNRNNVIRKLPFIHRLSNVSGT